MRIEFLGQGFTNQVNKPIGRYLIKNLTSGKFHSVTAISAFASSGGIKGLTNSVLSAKEQGAKINIIVGVDQKGTSKEALEALIDLKVNAFVFTQKEQIIFHPKIYLFEGNERSILIIGSSNLTINGLWLNVESSLLIEVENDSEDVSVIDDLKNYFEGLFNFTDPNLFILDKDLIEKLVKLNKLPMESERRKTHEKDEEVRKREKELVQKLIPKRSRIFPKGFFSFVKSENAKKKKPTNNPIAGKTKALSKGKLVWKRENLPGSSVQMAGKKTNPTGGLRLVQAKFEEEGKVIDQTNYFRKLFSDYDWTAASQNPFVEVTEVPFNISILEENLGVVTLKIRHKPTGEAGQGNYTTLISWGAVGEAIQEANLTGHAIFIYAPKDGSDVFHLEII